MKKISKTIKRALRFWKAKIKKKDFVVYGTDFPDEYVRRFLQKEDLTALVKRDLYLLKNKGEDVENLIYQFYWQILVKLLKIYEPWSIEKESALALYLGDESIPQKLFVRTLRKVKYIITLPFSLKIEIRPDPTFHGRTRKFIEVGRTRVCVDVPEKILFSIRERRGIEFVAFLKGIKFDRRMLEVLYSAHPKPVVAKELIKIAEKSDRADLSQTLKGILKRYTIYRP